MDRCYVAIDLGAGSGRVVAGQFGDDDIRLDVLHRFDSAPHHADGHERWDVEALFGGVKEGLRRLTDRAGWIVSVGVDTWGVDYALLDAAGRLIEDPVCYRDARTDGAVERVHALVSREELFRIAGLQTLPFNTIYQLDAQRHAGEWPDEAAHLVMIPDLFHHLLCGSVRGEVTIASTTELLSAKTRQWVPGLFARLKLPLEMMPSLVEPGHELGRVTPALQSELGLPPIAVVAPASHDTASAVVGAPLEPGWAYLSSGTWSLLGVETAGPILTDEVAREGLTNEAGAGGTNRLLKNIMGLWILESCRALWAEQGRPLDHETLTARISEAEPLQGFIDPDDPRFFHPADMVDQVRGYLRETGQRVPDDQIAIARIVLESLALEYARVVGRLEAVTGRPVSGVRIIGGGAQNRFLNQATAGAVNVQVRVGPVEASALGNLLIQAIADDRFDDVAAARRYVAARLPGEVFEPDEPDRWDEARANYASIVSRE